MLCARASVPGVMGSSARMSGWVQHAAVGGTTVDDTSAQAVAALAVASVVAGPARTPGSVLPRLLTAARRHLGMDVAFIAEFTEGQRVFRYVDSADDDSIVVGDADPLETTYCQRVVDGRLPELMPDTGDFPAALALPATQSLPVGAHISVPLVLDSGRVFGTFCCFAGHAEESLNERDLDVVRMFADVARQYIEDDLETTRQRDLMAARVDAAIGEEGQLATVYQPIIAIRDRRIVGVEALSRFAGTPVRSPDAWFAEAASIGRGIDLEVYALRRALRALDSLPSNLLLTVNLSAATVLSGRVDDDVLADIDPVRLVIEMTEHEPIADYDELAGALQPLRERGTRLAVDDAGAGYASLRHILLLRPEFIKLDISLTRGIDADPARGALAAALIDFAADVGSAIIAEGVETEQELDTLQRLGAACGQGYFFGRPAPLVEALDRHSTPVA